MVVLSAPRTMWLRKRLHRNVTFFLKSEYPIYTMRGGSLGANNAFEDWVLVHVRSLHGVRQYWVSRRRGEMVEVAIRTGVEGKLELAAEGAKGEIGALRRKVGELEHKWFIFDAFRDPHCLSVRMMELYSYFV